MLLIALFVAAAVFAGVRALGNFLVWRHYLDEENKHERADRYVEEFQEYVKGNKLSVKDAARISEWDAGSYVDILIYKDSTLFYAPDWFKDFNGDSENETSVGKETEIISDETEGLSEIFTEDTESSVKDTEIVTENISEMFTEDKTGQEIQTELSETVTEEMAESGELSETDEVESVSEEFVDKGWFSGDRGFVQYLTEEARETYLNRLDDILDGNRELNEIYFVDGTLFIMVVDYTEEFMNNLVFVISIVSALVVLGLIMMIFFNDTTVRIKKLAHNVKQVEGGKLDMPIEARGKDEIASLASDVDSMRNSIIENLTGERRAWEANTSLITAMSHDVRTPLTVLLGYLDLMEMQNTDPSTAEYISVSRDNALRLKRLSDDMFSYFLVFGRKDVEFNKVECSSDETIENMVVEHVFLLEEKGYRIERLCDMPRVKVLIDELYFSRVIDNIFSNIGKYASEADPILLDAIADDNALVLTFENKTKQSCDESESNRIGIKTCIKIMEYMGGSFATEEIDGSFKVILKIPLAYDK